MFGKKRIFATDKQLVCSCKMMIHLIRLIPANNRLRIRISLDFSLVAVFR